MKNLTDKPGIDHILHSFRLRNTATRLKVLEIIASKNTAVPYTILLRKSKISRITLYGVLQALEAKGIIYKLFDSDGNVHFAMSPVDTPSGPKVYLHFNCRVCKKIYCLTNTGLNPISAAKEFETHGVVFCGLGVCRSCGKKAAVTP
jgi:Fur family ferric uptake transcriptional regulator